MNEIIHRTIEVDDFNVRRAVGATERILEARALRYGVPYEVSDNGGRSFYHEVWRAGVFAKSLRERGERGKIPMHWHHQSHEKPYGAVFGVDDSPTDFVFRARIVNGDRGDEMIELIDMGAVNGVSIAAHPLRIREFGGGVERIEAALKEISLTSHAQIGDGEILAMRAVDVVTHTHSIDAGRVPPPPVPTPEDPDGPYPTPPADPDIPDPLDNPESDTPALDDALEFINSLERP